jgi:hypothetical protein
MRDGSGELWESSAAARGNREVRVPPEFENGWRAIPAHRATVVATLLASKPVGSLAADAQD